MHILNIFFNSDCLLCLSCPYNKLKDHSKNVAITPMNPLKSTAASAFFAGCCLENKCATSCYLEDLEDRVNRDIVCINTWSAEAKKSTCKNVNKFIWNTDLWILNHYRKEYRNDFLHWLGYINHTTLSEPSHKQNQTHMCINVPFSGSISYLVIAHSELYNRQYTEKGWYPFKQSMCSLTTSNLVLCPEGSGEQLHAKGTSLHLLSMINKCIYW